MGPQRLVRLRNPWGSKEWLGNWSDSSEIWTPQLQKLLQRESLDTNDGEFVMDFVDFKKYFSDIQICYIEENYQYASYRTSCSIKNAAYFAFTVPVKGKYYVSVL